MQTPFMATADTMDLSKGFRQSPRYVTYFLIVVNIIVFIAMVVGGVDFLNPSAPDMIVWGGNTHSYTAGGDWFRLLTNMFVHWGIVHLVFNMYALLGIGVYLERRIGSLNFFAAYLAAGIAASAVSIWWSDNRVSAGSSGAIFGMYGLALVLLALNYPDKRARKLLLQSALIFIAFNIIYTIRNGNIDIAANAGGLLSGLALGYIFHLLRAKEHKPQLFMPITTTLAIIVAAAVLITRRDDTIRFGVLWDEITALEEKAMAPLMEGEGNDTAAFVRQVESISMPAWMQMKTLMNNAQNFKLPKPLAAERTLMNKYVDLRILHTQTWLQLARQENERLSLQMDSLAAEIDKTVEQLKRE